MNKKYMDFVPVKPRPQGVVSKPAHVPTPAPVPKVEEPDIEEELLTLETEIIPEEDVLSTEADTFSLKKEPTYGVIEELHPKFVKTEVPKRPLSQGQPEVKPEETPKELEIAAVKSQKITNKGFSNPVEKPVEKSDKTENKSEDKAKLQIPKSPFINQNKVEKRPLSKNVYKKQVKPTEEKQTGPITIISKPEKDAKVSLIITIILTIILGAAAGTIAFLLLPK